MFSFARYAIDSIIRNWRRTIYAVIGIVLAVSLIAGSLIAIDSASFGLLKERIESVPVDYYGWRSYNDNSDLSVIDVERCEEASSKFLTVGGVEEVSYIVSNSGWSFLNSEGASYQEESFYYGSTGSIAFLPSDSSIILDKYRIAGDAPSSGTVAIPSTIATALGQSIGDEIVCSHVTAEYDYVNSTYTYSYVNISFEISQVWTQEGGIWDAWQWWYQEDQKAGDVTLGQIRNPVILPIESASVITDQLSDVLSPPTYSETYLVWINRNEYINLADIRSSIEKLEVLNGRLDRAGSEFDIRFSNFLTNILSNQGNDINQKRLIFIGLSLPIVALGLYLSLVGVEMGMNDRRREVGVLKSRGAGSRQVFASLVSESVMLGAFAGLLGLAIGILLSRFLMVTVSRLYDSGEITPDATSISVSGWTIAIIMIFGVLLMLMSSYRPMKRAANMPVAEALHQYTPRTVKVEYKSRYDIAGVVLVAYSATSVLWLRDSAYDWSGGSYMLGLLIVVSIMLGWAIVPVMPFLLSVSMIRLVTRGSRRLYTRFSWIVKRWTKELHYLVEKNIARNPKRASNIGIIVALAVAFGLFVSITMESELAYSEKVVFYEIGADIKYDGYRTYNDTGYSEINYSLLADMDSLDGVSDSVMFTSIVVKADYDYASMILFDSEELADMINIESGWYVQGGSDDIRDLKDSGTVFISQVYADNAYVVVGDTLHVTIDPRSEDADYTDDEVAIDLRVIGILEQLPGQRSDLYVDTDTLSFIGSDMAPPDYMMIGFSIMVEEGADHPEVADRVITLCRSAELDGYVEVAQVRLAEMMNTQEYRTMRDFLYLEYALSLVMLTCGVGLVLFVTVWDRRNELACIMARGASGAQVRRILMGESISLMTLGMTMGVAAGLLSAFLYGALASSVNDVVVSRDFVVSWISWAMVLSAIASFMLASLLATYNAGRIKLAEALRIRGG